MDNVSGRSGTDMRRASDICSLHDTMASVEMLRTDQGYGVEFVISGGLEAGLLVTHAVHQRTALVLALGACVVDSIATNRSPLFVAQLRRQEGDSAPVWVQDYLLAIPALCVVKHWIETGEVMFGLDYSTDEGPWSSPLAVTCSQVALGGKR